MKPALIAGFALVTAAAGASAQDALLPTASWGTGIGLSGWYFSKPLGADGGGLQAVAQVAVPFRVRAVFGRWSMDFSGAGAAGAAVFKVAVPGGGDGGGGDEGGDEMRLASLFGPTDLKVRLTGPIVGDNLVATLGLNIPTGKVGLNSEETDALQVLGAPAFRMPVASFGNGAGATLGVIKAFDLTDWALALGLSVEQRTEYSPIALALASGTSETQITPGMAIHFTGAIDRSLGENRLGVVLSADQFSKDEVNVDAVATSYQLGPQVGIAARLDIGSRRWRSSEVTLSYRLRGEFTNEEGNKVSGSSGTYLEGSLGGVLGREGRTGLILGTDFRMHSGLPFTDALVGAATTAAGVSIGWESPRQRSVFRFVLRGQYGTFDTGTAKSSGMGVSLGMSVAARREAQ